MMMPLLLSVRDPIASNCLNKTLTVQTIPNIFALIAFLCPQVWLADDSLLVLKGGSTPDRDGFDNPWRPIDDFEAPYREPVLPPPDFDPDSLDIGVGVPIETIVREQRERRDRESVRELSPAPRHVITQAPRHVSPSIPSRHVSPSSPPSRHVTTPPPSHVPVHISPIHNTIENDPLKPYKDDVDAGRVEFRQFLDDVSQFIADMESFHSVKQQAASKTLVRTLPPPPAPPVTTGSPVTQATPRSVSVTSSSPFPISYTSPNARVFLSTNYISHTPSHSVSTVSSTASPHRKQVEMSLKKGIDIFLVPLQARSTLLPTTASPVTTRRPSSGEGAGQEDWTPVTSAPAAISKYNRDQEFRSVVKQLPARVTPHPPVRESIRPSGDIRDDMV